MHFKPRAKTNSKPIFLRPAGINQKPSTGPILIQIHHSSSSTSSSKIDNLKRALAVIRVVALLVLTGFGIWDVNNLLYDYIVDNRFTAVRSINVTDRFPFLSDMEIYLDFGPNPAFLRQLEDFDQFQRLSSAIWDDGQIDWDNNGTIIGLDERKLSVAALDAYVFYFIDLMDRFGPNYTWNLLRDDLRIMNRSWDIREPWQLVDRYIGSRLDRMIDALRTLQSVYGGYSWPNWSLQGTPSRVWLNPGSKNLVPSFSLPLATSPLSATSPALRYAVLLVPSTFPSVHKITAQLHASGEFLYIQTFRNSTAMKLIKIYNSAVFNNEQFPPCTHEFKLEEDCLKTLRAKWIAEDCACEPLSHWTIEIMRNWTSDGNSSNSSAIALPSLVPPNFCTTSHYAVCWERANAVANARIEQIKTSGTCRPCISHKNTYIIDSLDQMEYQDEGDVASICAQHLHVPRLFLDFQCTDQTYILFEDKQQTGWSQLLSQIGGDLGLYVGFSMMTFLELILFAYHVYHEHEEYKNRGAKRGLEWARCFAQYVWSSLTDTGDNKMMSEEHERELKRDLEKEIVETAVEEDKKFTDELGEVERKLSQRLDEMERRFRMERIVMVEEFEAKRREDRGANLIEMKDVRSQAKVKPSRVKVPPKGRNHV